MPVATMTPAAQEFFSKKPALAAALNGRKLLETAADALVVVPRLGMALGYVRSMPGAADPPDALVLFTVMVAALEFHKDSAKDSALEAVERIDDALHATAETFLTNEDIATKTFLTREAMHAVLEEQIGLLTGSAFDEFRTQLQTTRAIAEAHTAVEALRLTPANPPVVGDATTTAWNAVSAAWKVVGESGVPTRRVAADGELFDLASLVSNRLHMSKRARAWAEASEWFVEVAVGSLGSDVDAAEENALLAVGVVGDRKHFSPDASVGALGKLFQQVRILGASETVVGLVRDALLDTLAKIILPAAEMAMPDDGRTVQTVGE